MSVRIPNDDNQKVRKHKVKIVEFISSGVRGRAEREKFGMPWKIYFPDKQYSFEGDFNGMKKFVKDKIEDRVIFVTKK